MQLLKHDGNVDLHGGGNRVPRGADTTAERTTGERAVSGKTLPEPEWTGSPRLQ